MQKLVNRMLLRSTLFSMLIMASLTGRAQTIVVAKDGSGKYKTVQAAFDAVPLHNTKNITIFIRSGVYKEKLHLDSTKDLVTLLGEDRFTTILTWDDHPGRLSASGDSINTRSSYSCIIHAGHFSAENITFQNDAGFTAGQAVALEADGDQLKFTDCRFIGNQDILFTNSPTSRQYYKDCYIEGTTDFIFGSATVWFEQCHIHSKKNSHVTAASTPQDHPFGYVFHDCVLTGDTSIHSASLGRPWRPYACVAYIHCWLGPHIRPDGWANWNNTDAYKTARYAEYQSYGPGANAAARVPWSKQLSEEDEKKYTFQNVFGNWNPLKK
ncbi:MAG TPA: pectinesterase family protein [Chitinophagaceae bacterium]